jgi:asparaginyl-tRNA synthetase
MIEPEIAFATADDVMDLAEAFVKYIAAGMCQSYKVGEGAFPRVSYTEAQEILVKAMEEGYEFEYPVGWGEALQAEHEKYLTEQVYKQPIFVTDYPIEQKAFYMRVNEDEKTVACFDLLVPGIGEIIGGSAREERIDKLLEQMDRFDMDPEHYSWYVDLRRYGSVPHGGFGLGFERALMWLLDIDNIRDALPYPRTPKQLT